MKRSVFPHRRLLLLAACACVLLLLVPPVLAADCPSGCSCLSPEDAKKLGYDTCSGKQVICSYDSAQRPMYCYQKPASLVAPALTLVAITATVPPAQCPEGCECLTDEQAAKEIGNFEHCSATPCAKVVTGSSSIVSYCSRPVPTQYPACPSGCECMNEVQAMARFGTYERCSDSQCAATTAATSNYPPYCYRQSVTPMPVCTAPCECMTEATAKAKFGENGYSRCSAASCGSESMTSAAVVVSKYCFQQAVTVLPATQCPSGCACMSEADAKLKGYPSCRGERTSCGYDATQTPLYCFEVVPSATCSYDYQGNTCSGICQQGYSCSIIAREKDATGAVKYAVCGCQPPDTGCSYNANLNACTGMCKEGTCAVTGKTKDANGAEQPICGCHTESCTFDYAKDTCTGSCPAGSGICQLNTIYRDAAGKTIYGECHCKEKPEETPATVTVTKTQPVPSTCTCTAGTCTGNCPDGQVCRMTATATDNLGKISCTECACKETCTLTADNECTGSCPDGTPCTKIASRDAATGVEKAGCACGGTAGAPATTGAGTAQAPDVISAIANFFRSLFGMK